MPMARRCLRAALLWIVTAASASTCPPGVSPGEFYGDPGKVWNKGKKNARCYPGNMTVLSSSFAPDPEADTVCAPAQPGETPTCDYVRISDTGHGGYVCPLTTANDTQCNTTASGKCADAEKCSDGYGACRCSQCPCAVEGQSGKDCELCEPTNCDDECKKGMIVEGAVIQCHLSKEFASGPLYRVLFPDKMAYAYFEYRVLGSGEDLRVEGKAIFSECSAYRELFAVNYTDCVFGDLEACQLSDQLTSPCLECQKASLDVHSNSYLRDHPQNGLVGLLETLMSGSIVLSCKDGNCLNYFTGITIDFGVTPCVMYSPCESPTSGTGRPVGKVAETSDIPGINVAIVGNAIIIGVTFLLVAACTVFAVAYKFNTKQEPVPLKGVEISWAGLSYSDLIREVEGKAAPGCFMCVMGPIGAGKSTLLKTLAGRHVQKEGSICLDGKPVSVDVLRRTIGFVPQHTPTCGTDTVGEAIGFAAAMSGGLFPEIGPLAEKVDAKICTLSGGQRRMVDVFVELARRPAVLLLDEPTTGLDTDNAFDLAKTLKEISKSIPVIATMHQPRPNVTKLFSEVYILVEGSVVYRADPLRRSVTAIADLEERLNEIGTPLSTQQNVVDYALDLVSKGRKLNPPANAKAKLDAEVVVDTPGDTAEEGAVEEPAAKARRFPSILRQIFYLAIRYTKRGVRRGPMRHLQTAGLSLLLGISYWQLELTVPGMHNRVGLCFMVLVFIGLQAISAAGDLAETHFGITHELDSKVYSRFCDAVVRVFGQVSGQLGHAIIMMLLVYPMCGLRMQGSRPLIFCVCIMACSASAAVIATLCRGRSADLWGLVRAASLLALFCGVLAKSPKDVDFALAALSGMSPFRHAFEVMVFYQVEGLQIMVLGAPLRGEALLDVLGLGFNFNTVAQSGANVGWSSLCWVVVTVFVLSFDTRKLSLKAIRAKLPKRREGRSDISVAKLKAAVIESADAKDEAQIHGISLISAHELAQASMVELSWSDLGNPDIAGVHGGVRSGMLLGIVGPCGSGKTTLAKMLAGRVKPSSGEIRINGKVMQPYDLSRAVGYVPQQDTLRPDDTVAEALLFARGGRVRTTAGQDPSIGQGLNQRIGDLSPGQTRLVAVAIELARRPQILVLDEPTSGLDAASSLELVQLVRLASAKIPVLMTLHQPRPELQHLLTHVMVMARGKVHYSLPFADFDKLMAKPGNDSGKAPTLEKADAGKLQTRKTIVALDDLLEGKQEIEPAHDTSAQTNSTSAQTTAETTADSGQHLVSAPIDVAMAQLDQIADSAAAADASAVAAFECTPSLPAARLPERALAVKVLFMMIVRDFRCKVLRRWSSLLGKVFLWVFAGACLALSSNKDKRSFSNNINGLVNRSILFLGVNVVIGILTFPTIHNFFEERASVLQELEARVASPALYTLSWLVSFSLERIVQCLCFAGIMVISMPLNGETWINLLVIFSLTGIVSGCLAYAISNVSKSYVGALALQAGLLCFMLMFGASLVVADNSSTSAGTGTTAAMTEIAMKASFYHFSYAAMMRNEVTGLRNFVASYQGVTVTTWNTEQIMEYLGTTQPIVEALLVLIAYALGFLLIGIAGLYRTLRPRQRAAAF